MRDERKYWEYELEKARERVSVCEQQVRLRQQEAEIAFRDAIERALRRNS